VARGVERGKVRMSFHADTGPTPDAGSDDEIVLDEKDYTVK
jgi:hypothetical protein